MLNIIEIILPITIVILLWALIYSINNLQLHLYEHYRTVWEEVTFKQFFFIKRKNLQILPVNHKIFRVLFSKNDFEDKTMDALIQRTKVLLTCVIVSVLLICLVL